MSEYGSTQVDGDTAKEVMTLLPGASRSSMGLRGLLRQSASEAEHDDSPRPTIAIPQAAPGAILFHELSTPAASQPCAVKEHAALR